jgi:hypothetical protein
MRSLIAEFPSIVQMYEAKGRNMRGGEGGAMSERDSQRRFERFCAEIFSQLLIHQSIERKKEKEKEEKEQEVEEEDGGQEEEGEQHGGADDEDRLREKEEKEEEEAKRGGRDKIRETRGKLEKQNSELSFTQGEGGGDTMPSCSVDVKRMRTSLEAEMRRVRVQTVDDFVETQLQVSCRC